PVGPDDILIGEVLWSMTRSLIYGGGFFVVAALFGLVPFPGGLGALVVIPLAGLLFAAIGLAFTMRIPFIDLFSFYFTLFLTPLFLFSDVFFPIRERLPGAWLIVAEALPLLHPVRLARSAFQGEWGWVALWDLGYILAVSALLLEFARRGVAKRLMS
ncbi:MAG: ABC transporter permease, partial [Defluviicoccus sp.]|nr:ABC transporter permease [Defluviicoccus sp.]